MAKLDYYINQRNNPSFGGKLSPHIQCFYSSAVMWLSYYKHIEDDFYERYVDDVEKTVGKPGIAERLFPKLTGRTGAYWDVHKEALNQYTNNVKFDNTIPYDSLLELLSKGPVITGTKKIGLLSGGHVILSVKADKDGVTVKDPYGNAMTNYKNFNGNNVVYPHEYLRKYFSNHVIWHG